MNIANNINEYEIDDIRRLKIISGVTEGMFEQVINNLMIGFCVFRVTSESKAEALYLSQNYFKVIGYTMEEYKVHLKNITSHICVEDEKNILIKAKKCTKRGDKFDTICKGYKADKRRAWYSITAVRVGDENDSEAIFFAIINDVTSTIEENDVIKKLKQTEEKLIIEKQRYRVLEETTEALLFEYIPAEDTMVFTYNFPNNHECKVIGKYMEFIEKTPLVHKSHIERFKNALIRACEIPVKETLEYLSEVSGKGYQWHRTIYTSVTDNDNKIISVMGRVYNVNEEVLEREKQAGLAKIDGLTGAYIREAGYEMMKNSHRNNDGRGIYLVLIDVDNFKRVNDTRGHSMGDTVLKRMCQKAIELIGDKGFITRYGGDEFIIYIENIEYDNLIDRINALHEYMAAFSKDYEINVDFSEGIAEWKDMTLSQAFEVIDSRMYENKRNK